MFFKDATPGVTGRGGLSRSFPVPLIWTRTGSCAIFEQCLVVGHPGSSVRA